MSSTTRAMVRRPTTTPSRTRRSPTVPSGVRSESFVVEGRTYRWLEGSQVVPSRAALSDPATRASLPAHFTRTLVPQLERRGARGLVFAAKACDGVGADEVRWIAWRAQGDRLPVWGLFVASKRLGESAPANDAFALVAWGDGPALAWADERVEARAALRAALREPPPWLARGMRSGDPTFPVRIDRVAGPSGSAGAPCVGVVRAGAALAAPTTGARATQDPAALLEIVQGWKPSHGPSRTG